MERQFVDFEINTCTLRLLAQVVEAGLGVLKSTPPNTTADGHFPVSLDRDYEEQLVELAASGDLSLERWAAMGPRFFMAGLAVMLATDGERRGLLELAERLHPGVAEVGVFNRWLSLSPLRPSRFLPLVDTARRAHAA